MRRPRRLVGVALCARKLHAVPPSAPIPESQLTRQSRAPLIAGSGTPFKGLRTRRIAPFPFRPSGSPSPRLPAQIGSAGDAQRPPLGLTGVRAPLLEVS